MLNFVLDNELFLRPRLLSHTKLGFHLLAHPVTPPLTQRQRIKYVIKRLFMYYAVSLSALWLQTAQGSGTQWQWAQWQWALCLYSKYCNL